MSQYNKEFIKKLAEGDKEAHHRINALPLPVRMSVGLAIEEYLKKIDTVEIGGNMTLYDKKPTQFTTDEEVGQSLKGILDREKETKEMVAKKIEEMQK